MLSYRQDELVFVLEFLNSADSPLLWLRNFWRPGGKSRDPRGKQSAKPGRTHRLLSPFQRRSTSKTYLLHSFVDVLN